MDDNKREQLMNYMNNKHQDNPTNQSKESIKQDNTAEQSEKNNQTVIVEQSTESKADTTTTQPVESINQADPAEVGTGWFGNRKPRTKKQRIISAIVSVVCIVVGVIAAIWAFTPTAEVFTKLEMQITLTDDFVEDNDYVGYLTTYQSEKLLVLVLREEFTEIALPSDATTTDYLELLKLANNKTSCLTLLDSSANAYYFEYNQSVSSVEYCYKAYAYKSQSAFWCIQFVCKKAHKSNLNAEISKYASSVKMDVAA